MDYKHRHEFNLLIEMLEYAIDEEGLKFKTVRTHRTKDGKEITCNESYGICTGGSSINCKVGGSRPRGIPEHLVLFVTDIDKQNIQADEEISQAIAEGTVTIEPNNDNTRKHGISFDMNVSLFKRAIHILTYNNRNVSENGDNKLSRIPSEKDPCIVKYRIKQENQVYIQYLDWQYSLYHDMSNCKAGDFVHGSDGYDYEIMQVYKAAKPQQGSKKR